LSQRFNWTGKTRERRKRKGIKDRGEGDEREKPN
jgi:hypothetical protein